MQPTNEQILHELDEIKDMLRGHVGDSLVWRQRVESELNRNTEVTEEIRSASNALGWLKRAVIWVGSLAVGITGIVGLWQLLSGGGGIGPTP
jgi:hypothetical protein